MPPSRSLLRVGSGERWSHRSGGQHSCPCTRGGVGLFKILSCLVAALLSECGLPFEWRLHISLSCWLQTSSARGIIHGTQYMRTQLTPKPHQEGSQGEGLHPPSSCSGQSLFWSDPKPKTAYFLDSSRRGWVGEGQYAISARTRRHHHEFIRAAPTCQPGCREGCGRGGCCQP